MIKIMIVDDHKMIREGLKRIIEFDGNMKVLYGVGNGKEAVSILDEISEYPDIILLDINMPEMNGIETLRLIKKKKYPIKVLILTACNDINFLIDAIDLDIYGYLLKSADSNELIRAINYVFSGKKFIQPSLIPLLNARLIARDIELDKFNKLSDRELDVLRFVAMGFLNKEIAIKLNISERTVKNHLSNIFKKIDCTDRTQAAIFAVRNGLVNVH